jgi:Flp pilus assembly protein TadG
MRRPHDQEGSVTAFFVVVVFALLMLGGLALDGGRILAARRDASSLASAAARRGAQELDFAAATSGRAALDPARAEAAARAFLAQAGASGTASASANEVVDTVAVTQPTVLLRLVAISSRTVSATRRAVPVSP